jgi:hypothetical protein
MASKEFEDWLSGQPHARDKEIPNIQRPFLKYIPPSAVRTWGEWYDAAKIIPDFESNPQEEKPKPTKAETDTTKKLRITINITEKSIEEITTAMYGMERGSTEYKEYQALLKLRKQQLVEYKARFKAAEVKENKPKVEKKNADATADYESKLKSWEQEVADAEDNLQVTKDTGGNVPEAKAELERVKGEKPKPPKLEPTPTVTPTPQPAPKGKDKGTTVKIPKTSLGYTQNDKGVILDTKGKPANGNYVMQNEDGTVTQYVLENGLIKPDSTYIKYNKNGTTITYGFDGKEIKAGDKPPTDGTPKIEPDGKPKVEPEAKPTKTKDGTVIPVGQDDKTNWVSYLKTTFKTLEDPAQKKEIDALITRANLVNMDEEQFMSQLSGTKWWKNTYPSLRQFFIESNDPRNKANFAEKVTNNIQLVTRKLESLGIRINDIDPTTGKIIDNTDLIKGIALQNIQNSWDDNDLNEYLSTRSDVLFTGGGTIGSTYETIKRQAALYGVSLDKTFEKEINLSLLDTNDMRDANYWLTEMKQQAYDNPMYKAFAPAMKENNRTLYEVTNSYRKQMADLLEVDPTQVTWRDLMDKAVDGTTGNARTFADFTKALKKDPMWQYTKNAKETYSGTALDIAKMFGFQG